MKHNTTVRSISLAATISLAVPGRLLRFRRNDNGTRWRSRQASHDC
jgi:hypothetical protein